MEKPKPEQTTSNKAVPAFYVYSRECVALLDEFVSSTPTMEARDAPGTFLQWLIPRGVPMFAVGISGRYDIGSLADLLTARTHLHSSQPK
jgi:dTDP-glucose pyrophosphorylase